MAIFRGSFTLARVKIMSDERFKAVRVATGFVRPTGHHGCPPVEVIPGLFNAEYHHIDSAEKLVAISPNIKLVVNTATVQCPPVQYRDGVTLLLVEGLNDDPDPRKKVMHGVTCMGSHGVGRTAVQTLQPVSITHIDSPLEFPLPAIG